MYKKILRKPLFYLLPLLAALYLIAIPDRIRISDAKITRNDKTENIQLPFSVDMAAKEVFFISFDLYVKNENSAKLNITPDDCIQEILINGKAFPLEGVKGLCDYSNGTYLDFSKYVQEGSNNFVFRIINNGAPGGLRVEIPSKGFKSLSLIHYIFTIVLLASIVSILRKFKFKFFAISIILLGITMRLITYSYTSPTQNGYDVGGHLRYIQIIAEEKRMPKINEGWSTYHPPLYYITSAAIKSIAEKHDAASSSRFLQQWSLVISFASVIFGVALILNLLGNCRFAYLASLVLALWPGFVMAAPRIGNDSLFYFGALLCMFFAQRYWYFHKNLDVLWATIGASVAVAAKATGFAILGVWVVIYVLNAMRSLKTGSLRILLASVFIAVPFIGLSNYRTAVEIYDKQKLELVGNINSLNGGMKVQNRVGNYVYFDLQDYLLEPYASTWNDKGGRQYFWNFALKTSLFGEFKTWNSPIGNIFATMLNLLALLIFALALWGIIHAKFRELPPLLFLVSLFAALICLRISYPYSCSNDFRYIFPALFPLVYFAVRGTQILQDSRLKMLSYSALLAFAGLSFVFVAGQAF